MKNVILVALTLFLAAHVSGQTLQDAQREMDNENYFKAKHVLFKLLNDGTSNKSEITTTITCSGVLPRFSNSIRFSMVVVDLEIKLCG